MEDLMVEATDLVLTSSRRNSFSEKSARPDSRHEDPPFESYVSSVALMKLTILESFKNRCVEIEVPEDATPKRKKRSKKYKDLAPSPGRIDIRPLGGKTPVNEEAHVSNEPAEVSVRSNTPHSALNRLSGMGGSNSARHEHLEKGKEEAVSKRDAQNGLRLARRRCSDGIFENCSTYNLACSEVLLKDDDVALSGKGKPSVCMDDETNIASDKVQSELNRAVGGNTETEDPVVSLGDSFFASVTDEADHFRNRTISSKSLVHSLGNESCDSHSNPHRERKLNKRGRKRHKRNSSAYTCPRCRVSYTLSPNSLMSTVRCLHCDYWTSVEPVFVKQEKMAWNICRIC